MLPSPIRYAVIFKTYTWDAFTERQARRCEAAACGGDFYISLDTTGDVVSTPPFPRVLRISNSSLVGEGWPDRVEHKSFLWWNADYPHYQFHRTYPDYDYYIFVEYDAALLGSWDAIVGKLASQQADFAAFPLRVPLESWHWAERHAATYSAAEVQGCLMCISVQSNRALQILGDRRLAMARQTVPYWPSAEVFLPSEVRRAGLKCVSLDDFADGSRFDWHPPVLEAEMTTLEKPAFLHPVYDQGRFLRWALAHTATLPELLSAQGPVRQALTRLPRRVYLRPYLALLWRAVLASGEQHARRFLAALRQQSSCP